MQYETPKIEVVGSVRDLTLGSGFGLTHDGERFFAAYDGS